MQLTDEQIEIVVDWWANQIQNPTFHTQTPGENNKSVAMAEVLATALVTEITPEQIEEFKTNLKTKLEHPGTMDSYRTGIFTDYGPDAILGEAAEEASINTNNFPWKTSMWFLEDGRIQVRCGYGAEAQTIYGEQK